MMAEPDIARLDIKDIQLASKAAALDWQLGSCERDLRRARRNAHFNLTVGLIAGAMLMLDLALIIWPGHDTVYAAPMWAEGVE